MDNACDCSRRPSRAAIVGAFPFRQLKLARSYNVVMRSVLIVPLLVLPMILASCDYGTNENPVITFHNTTDSPFCYANGPAYSGCEPTIKARGKSKWAVDSCFGGGIVTLWRPGERALYSRTAACEDWARASFIINQRDGQFIVVDNLPPEATNPYSP